LHKINRFDKFLHNLSMKVKVYLALIVVSIITLLIAGVVSYYASRTYNQKEAVNSSKQIVNLISNNLNEVLSSFDNTLVTLAVNDEIIDYFKNARNDREYDRIERTRLLEKNLQKTLYPNNMIQNVLCYPSVGYSISVGDINSSFLKEYQKFDVYQAAINSGGRNIWFGVHDFEGNDQGYNITNIVSVARTLKNFGSDDILGVIEIQINEQFLYELFSSLNDTNNSIIVICDTEGNIVTGDKNSKSIPNTYFSAMKDSLVKNARGTFTGQLMQEKYLFNFVTLKNGWKVVHLQPYSNLIQASLEVGRIIILTGFSLIFAVSLAAFLLSDRLMKPLTQFIIFSGNIKNGHTSEMGVIQSNKEFGDLYGNYNVMLRKIKESELDTLRAQITPHFLYNTLNSIKCRAYLDNNKQIESMTESLITLLELSISNPNEYIPIRDELKIVDSYILLQQSRQPGNFTVYYDTPPELLDYLIPKMLLQPIVENSIIHGFEDLETAGEIHIDLRKIKNELQIEIRDNGVGMNEEQIVPVFSLSNQTHKPKFNRIGLMNVNERIKLYLGEKYGLTLTSVKGQGTTVIVNLPCVINTDELLRDL